MHLRYRPSAPNFNIMEKDELFIKRIQELATVADRRGHVTFTDFLNLNEQHILHQTLQKFSWIRGETFGGYEGSERCIAAFVPDAVYYEAETDGIRNPEDTITYPIACIRIQPLNLKFAEKLSHRDILGSLMNLGIERSKTGDIAVGDTESYLFCHSSLAELICTELTRIRHTVVQCQICTPDSFSYTPKLQRISGSVASVRLDALMSVALQTSRSSLISLIEEGKVFVNGKLMTTNAYSPAPGDLISVRGHGKFRYISVSGQTKKGRCIVDLDRYI